MMTCMPVPDRPSCLMCKSRLIHFTSLIQSRKWEIH